MGWWEAAAVATAVLLSLINLREVWYARGCAGYVTSGDRSAAGADRPEVIESGRSEWSTTGRRMPVPPVVTDESGDS